MLKVNCPTCGAEVSFRSPALPVVVCPYCQSMVTRIGDDVRAVGKAAVLPFDVSPIRIGTRGNFEGLGFEVIGRVRWGWSDGSWNEWLLLFNDNNTAWLGEAMGQFMLLGERPIEQIEDDVIGQLVRGGEVRIDQTAVIDGHELKVSDMKRATCLAAEGELPFQAPPGWTIHNVDFRSTDGSCASFQKDSEEANLYVGRYVTLAELKPQGLREIEGWPRPAFAAA